MKRLLAAVLMLILSVSLVVPVYADSGEDTAQPCELNSRYSNISVGDWVYMGTYEQDNNKNNGKEDIEWLVLDVRGSRVLLLSRYALDRRKFNSSYTSITWRNSSLRSWLNDTFLDKAFSSREKNMILSTTVYADDNPIYDVPAGKDTTDKIFLLSILEASKYLQNLNTDDILCYATEYAIAHGALVDHNGCAIWWLRTPGLESDYASYVSSDGYIIPVGHDVNDSLALRPAMWIDLNA